MYIRATTKKYAIAGEPVCTVEILDGNVVLARGTSLRGGGGLAPHDARSLREHTEEAAQQTVQNLNSKAKTAAEAVNEFLHGKESK